MKTNGLILGKFAPLTTGHVSCIMRASTYVDDLYVVLCYDEKFNKTLSNEMAQKLTRRNRHLWLLETFQRMENIHIAVVDETEIKSFPEGAKQFTDIVRKELAEKFEVETFTHVFSSETAYDDYFEQNFAEAMHILIDPERKDIAISATQVRNDIYGNWHYIAPAARVEFIKHIAVIGSESTGKSTLVKQLAAHYDTVYVPEVGRAICEDQFHSHEEYMYEDDYIQCARAHKEQESYEAQRADKVLFSDTNNLITEYAAVCMGIESEVLASMSRNEKYDLVLFLDIDVPWVRDNLRRNGDPAKRRETNELLKQLCHDRGVKNLVTINGTFTQRFDRSVAAIDALFGGAL